MDKIKKESGALSSELNAYRQQAEAKLTSLAAARGLDAAARRELQELQLVMQAALAQVDVLARQAALADLLQHRLTQQEEVLAALQVVGRALCLLFVCL
ncbi:hypothetical protein MNEG_14074 [Monoraphidium neglectum]|uniref:Uncharacterized protein n=1 Tax=Monoraphidium neglectum TaxID=145388 RepID=A0A0D2LQ70_9CHLO|nr:hypothetical protein MNEG_14074 [Monoraphidium neglectum]KIY93889.1 hypothetical protein MNEG_14074 [Monoraphidium neglectum]|eukprot:XP_013892909.1 hypothetical protein MNEG_14074 [Monoraphidium neglectum]